MPETFWPRLIEKWKKQFIFIQVGLASDTPLPGIAARYAAGQSFATARQLFALMERASLLIGINSAPMHVARAFDLPSLILTRQGNIQEIFRNRSETPYYLRDNWKHGFLYEENRHFDFLTEAAESAQSVADDFLSSARYNSRE